MKRSIGLIIIIITVLTLNKSYYYFAYKNQLDKINFSNDKPVIINQDKNKTANYTIGKIKFNINLLTDKELICEENRCTNSEVLISVNSNDDIKVESPNFYSFGEKTYLYNLEKNDIDNFIKENKIEYLSDLIMYFTKEDYKKVNFISSNKNIKDALLHNSFKSVSIPKVEKTYVINNNIIAYKLNKDTYSMEFKKDGMYNSIMIKKEMNEKSLLKFIKTIEVVSEN